MSFADIESALKTYHESRGSDERTMEADLVSARIIEYLEIAEFTSHPFAEGNTRTVAVFSIQYLQSLGVSIDNDPFEQNARYFSDALVRNSFIDIGNGINRNDEYIKRFFDNTIYHTKHNLKSEDLIVPQLFESHL